MLQDIYRNSAKKSKLNLVPGLIHGFNFIRIKNSDI